MIKKFITMFFVCMFAIHSIGFSQELRANRLYCTSELTPVLRKVQQLPEVNRLIAKILQEGPVYIKVNTDLSPQFAGYWSFYERTIYITKINRPSECSLISTLLIELHNASRNSELKDLTYLASHRQIGRQKYIDAVEYIEYENVWETSFLLNKGTERGLFPVGCRWDVSDNFRDHLAIQKAGGHSESIGRVYDELTPQAI